jgi:uncharacterized protein YndB with AHSA1/START domain
MSHRIDKTIFLNAPVSRVWRALTDHREFGEWFCVNLDSPFVPGQISTGKVTYPGYEYLTFELMTQKLEPERVFAFSWHPYAIDPQIDYSKEPSTLVEFRLEPKDNGTVLHLSESGFEGIPENRRFEAFRKNDEGWTEQMENITRYLER